MATAPSSPTLSVFPYEQVQHFYAHQAQLLDAGLHDEAALRSWTDTFTEDGTFRVTVNPDAAVGRAAIFAVIRDGSAVVRERGIVRRHWFGMLSLTPIASDDSIEAAYYALVIGTEANEVPEVFASTVTTDLLVRREGRLLVRSREVARDDLAPYKTGRPSC